MIQDILWLILQHPRAHSVQRLKPNYESPQPFQTPQNQEENTAFQIDLVVGGAG